MVRKSVFLMLALCGVARADTGFTSSIKITETDNSPSCVVGQIKVSTGTLTCAGQTATISTGGGGGSGNYVSKTGDTISGDLEFTLSSIGPILLDSNGCTWRAGVDTSGVLTTALLNCPASGFILMEDGTFILQEDSSKILVE